MGLQQNRFPMGKSGGINWWPWIVGGGFLLVIGGILFYRRSNNSSVMPKIDPPKEKEIDIVMAMPVQEQLIDKTPIAEDEVSEPLLQDAQNLVSE